MRKLVVAVFAALTLAVALAPGASASTGNSSRLSLTAKITRFHATAAGVVGDGTLTGTLTSPTGTTRDSSHVKFAVLASSRGHCNILTLKLAPVFLDLLGLQVQTSYINLKLYAVHGAVLGDLFCSLAHAKVTFPHAARDLNARLTRHPLRVMSTSDSLPASIAQAEPVSCQVVKLVLGPLHLNLLGLVVELYGQNKSSPVVVTIDAVPSEGLLGQLLCGLSGGSGINSLAGLQNLLSSLGLNLSSTQVQDLLNQLGITDLTTGLSQADINRILAALGLGSVTPS